MKTEVLASLPLAATAYRKVKPLLREQCRDDDFRRGLAGTLVDIPTATRQLKRYGAARHFAAAPKFT